MIASKFRSKAGHGEGRSTRLDESLLLAALIFAAGAAQADSCKSGCANEPEPFFQAPQIATPAILNGPDYKVIPEVQIRGFMAHFIIDTQYGPLHADSVQLLSIRVSEIPAIGILEKASHSGAFAHALAERGKKAGSAIVNVFAHPVDSITGLPMGVVRYFKKQIDTWAGRAQSASDRGSRIFENKGDPYRAPDGPMTAAREVEHGRSTVSVGDITRSESTATLSPPDADDRAGSEDAKDPPANASKPVAVDSNPVAEKKNRAWYARAGSEVGRETKRYLSYNQARSEIAKYLGIDPNTSNPFVVERLDSLAWAATWGNFSAREALGTIVGPAADVISDTGLVNEYVLKHTPEQVRQRIEKNLTSVCSDEFGIRQFTRRGGFNDTLRTDLTDSLVKLKLTAGCNELLELGATTRGEVEARYLVDALAMILAKIPDTTGGKLVIAGAAVVYLAPDGRLVLPLAVDYLSWTTDIDEFFNRSEFVHADKTLLIGGDVSPLALQKLGERGWQVSVRAPYKGAPVYATGPEQTVR